MANVLKRLYVLLLLVWCFNSIYCQNDGIVFDDEQTYLKFLFLFGGILVIALINHAVTAFELSIPYSVFVLIFGILWGVGALYNDWMYEMSEVTTVAVENMVEVYLPILIFSTGFRIDPHALIRSLPQILVISIPVALLSGTMTGMLMRMVIETKWSYVDAMIFGLLSSAVYPTDILRWLKETNYQTKSVKILLEGETLVSAAFVVTMNSFLLLHVDGWVIYWYQFVMGCVVIIGIGFPLSYIFGVLGVHLMRFCYNDDVVLMLVTIAICYTSFFAASWLANAGIFASIVTGLMMGIERLSLSSNIEKEITNLWRLILQAMNGIVYLLIGVRIPLYLKGTLGVKDYVLVLVTYLVTNMSRFICFFLFSPLLSRIGYGMSFQTMVICVWTGLKNPICLNLAVNVASMIGKQDEYKARLFFLHTVGVFMLMLLINGSFLPVLLKALGLADISTSRQINMNNCMKYIYEARARTIAILKMDRFLSDANWPLVLSSTSLKHPYKKINQEINNESEEDEDYFLGYKFTFCPDCQKNIPNEPTPKEIKDMTKEAKLRVLKLKKTAYSRQYENGMLSKEGVRSLHQAVETAMDSDESVIELDELYKMFGKQVWVYKFVRNRLQQIAKVKSESYKAPRRKWMFWCYRIVNHIAFSAITNIVVVLHMAYLTYFFGNKTKIPSFTYDLMIITSALFFVFYLLEFWFKIFAFTWIYVCAHGFRTYFKSYWNILEIVILWMSLLDLIVHKVFRFDEPINQFNFLDLILNILLAIRISRLVIYLKLCSFCRSLSAVLIKFFSTKVDRHVSFAVELAKNYIVGEEEILDNLQQIIDNDKIRAVIKAQLENDRLAITKRLGFTQKERPWVVSTVKTKTAMNIVLNSMRDDINELKISGWVDEIEHSKLLRSLSERYKYVNSLKSIQPSAPKLIFSEAPFMGDDDDLIEFLYANVATKKYDPGDIVINEGDIVEGIYIIITGMLQVSYTPKESVLEKLKEIGALPVLDFLCSPNYEEPMYDYIVPGNTLGELSMLTERPYNGVVMAETHSQAYVLNRSVVKKAMEKDSDPVNGFECRLWKYVAFRRAINIMINVPSYRSYSHEKIKYVLERAFVPNLSNYKIFVVNEMMEDILLIEGVVVDYNTREVYTAPSYIPRAVQKLILPKSSYVNIEVPTETKLMIIPAKDYNEYEIMITEEEACALVDDKSSKCLQHLMQSKASLDSKVFQQKKRLMGYSKQMRKKMLTTDSAKSRITFASSDRSDGISKESQPKISSEDSQEI